MRIALLTLSSLGLGGVVGYVVGEASAPDSVKVRYVCYAEDQYGPTHYSGWTKVESGEEVVFTNIGCLDRTQQGD